MIGIPGAWAEEGDGRFEVNVGGRIQADYDRFEGLYTQDGKHADAAYWRRLYLTLDGQVYHDWAYDLTYKLADGAFKSATLAYQGLDPVTLTFGMFDPDFGLDKATSSKWITAIERTLAYDVAGWINSGNRDPGIQLSGVAGSAFYASASVMNRDDLDTDSDRDSRQVNGRAVWAPRHTPGDVWHLGIDYAYRDLHDTGFDSRIRSRMNVQGVSETSANGFRPTLSGFSDAPAGSYGSDRVWGVELAWAQGALTLQAESTWRRLEAETRRYSDIRAHGYYGQIAYTLTGEPRDYDLEDAGFGPVTPDHARFGAWEVFYRYGSLQADDVSAVSDPTSGALSGSADSGGARKVSVHTLGLNWYASGNIRIMMNLLHVRSDALRNGDGDESGNALTTRVQYVF